VRVHAIETGTVAVKESQREGHGSGPMRLVNTLRDKHWTDPLPIYAWAIEHPEGVIVIDTGETARTALPGYLPRWHPYFRLALRIWVNAEDEIGPQLARIGIQPTDVRWVVMTHLHTDHAGGLAHFPDAEILVSRAEYKAGSGLSGRINGYLPNRWPDWFDPSLVELEPDEFGPFSASMALTQAGDVRIVATPGHSKGHMSVILEEEDGTSVLFAGDTSYSQELMLRGVVDGVSPDVAAAADTLERIKEYTAGRRVVYLPSHDPRSAGRLEARAAVGS
jgi:glyoxylase-like metal-dependent hydrolase (beta-lactamase superfamily II)